MKEYIGKCCDIYVGNTLVNSGACLYVDESINNPKGGNKGLRYDELIADLIATVQSQNERLKSLEASMKLDEKE